MNLKYKAIKREDDKAHFRRIVTPKTITQHEAAFERLWRNRGSVGHRYSMSKLRDAISRREYIGPLDAAIKIDAYMRYKELCDG